MARKQTTRSGINGSGADPNERDLIERAKGGDKVAFQVLLLRIEPTVSGMATRMLQSGPEVEDVVNEVAEKVWKGIHTFEYKSSFSTWVCTIAVNCCLTELKKRHRHRERYTSLEHIGAEDAKSERWRENVETSLQIARQVWDNLKPEPKRIVDMVRWRGESEQEAAVALGVEIKYVRNVLSYFSKKVKRAVKEHVPGRSSVARAATGKLARAR